jgi:cytochrome c biogenesis protein CcmG/thiol:disulfide interchange protein DsbE
MKLRALIPLLVFIVLVILLAIGLTRDPKKIPSPLIGKAAPQFELPAVLQPQQKVSSEDFLGKVALFNVWASWCVACRQEHPLLVEFSKNHKTPIYGLNYKDQRSDAIRWLEAFGNPYISSAFDLSGTVGIDWGVYGVPETFLIDKQGIIRFKQIGPVTDDVINNELLPLIQKLEQES